MVESNLWILIGVVVVGFVVVVIIGLIVWYNFKCFLGWENI